MNYPLISEYIEAIKSAEDNFEELSYLRPVMADDGLPVMTSGNFAVVFKMKDERDGKLYAVKCFTKEQEGRAEAYRQITEELKDLSSPYLTSVRYLDKELFVDTDQTNETEFPVLLMDWVEGKTLDKYLRENLDDKYALEMLAYRFSKLAQWLIPQPFAHGDLKPDNILVREDGTLVLVDYDGMYVPAMKGQKARELGSPDFRHPLRTEDDFDEHIDDFPLVSILLSLKAISITPHLLNEYGASDRLLFSFHNYHNIDNSFIIKIQFDNKEDDYLRRLFIVLCHYPFTFSLPSFAMPYKEIRVNGIDIRGYEFLKLYQKDYSNEKKSIDPIDNLMVLDLFLTLNRINYVLTGSLGLYLHGFVPDNYIPHDIDIKIWTEENNYGICQFLDALTIISQTNNPEYDTNEDQMYSFCIGPDSMMVNAFVNYDKVPCKKGFSDCQIMKITGSRVSDERFIKVHGILQILEQKYVMKRWKDYQFYLNMQNITRDFFKDKVKNCIGPFPD